MIYTEPKFTPGRRQSKTLSTIDERGSKIEWNSVFDSHLSPMWRQMAIENTVSFDFWSTFLDSIGVFDCRLPGVKLWVATFQFHFSDWALMIMKWKFAQICAFQWAKVKRCFGRVFYHFRGFWVQKCKTQLFEENKRLIWSVYGIEGQVITDPWHFV